MKGGHNQALIPTETGLKTNFQAEVGGQTNTLKT